ncbi:MAG TPA: CPBP family intramembrane glutamic endopeptidase, partial [Bryobacteraceae bacterium]|nr:CPBP family intramembrane glutamic endopeptidase [Bryobacteraceae bacterium]
AAAQARALLPSLGFRAPGYHEASSFTFDDDAKTFLEREAGLEQANRLMGTRVRLWRWSFRWFRPQQKERFQVDITPRGELVGFNHDIAEDLALPTVSEPAARALAEDCLRNRMHRPPESLDFVERNEQVRPHRVDRFYTWKERDFHFHDATYRVEVEIDGNQVAQYREYLHIPEQWTRDYQRLRSKNEAAQTVDLAFMSLLMVGLVVTIVLRLRRQDVRWRLAAWIGIAGMVLSFLAHLNQFPLSEFDFPTTDSYSSFVFSQMLQGALSALGFGGVLFVLAAGAETMYRDAMPGQISLGHLFRLRGLRTRRFFLGASLGIALTAIFIAYQTVFYIVAQHFGAWSPADVPYSDLLNTRLPWLFVLFGGYFPAISEEFLFRMFAIPFLRKLLRATVPAVILAGFIWGFGHAGYPQQPFYIRGVEVGIGGVALGLIMLRWGILPTLVWHYSVDAMYSAMLLLRSHSLYFRLSGAASAGIIVLPVVVALVAYWRRGGFEPETGLLNAEEPPPVEVPAEAAPPAPVAAASRRLGVPLRLAAAALLALGLLTLLIPRQRFGEQPRYRISEDQALAAANSYVRSLALDPGAFLHVTYADDRPEDLTAKYFVERLPLPAASRLFDRNRPLHVWATRYFKPLNQEEIQVSIDPETGRPLGFRHTLPEDRPGANLPEDAARQLAADFAARQGWSTAGMVLKVDSSEKQKARTDHTLEWEAPAGDPRNVAEAHYRIAVAVDGDQVTMLRSYWDIPETYQRFRDAGTLASYAVTGIKIMVAAGLVVWGLGIVLRNVRRGRVPWRRVLAIAAIPTAAMALGQLLSVRMLLRNYRTEIPLPTFQAVAWIGIGLSVMFGFLMMAAAVALLASCFPATLEMFSKARRRALGVDALAALAAAAGLALVWNALEMLLRARFHSLVDLDIGTPGLLGSAFPAGSALAGAVQSVVGLGAIGAVVVLVVQRLEKPWRVALLALVVAVAGVPGSARTPAEFLFGYATAAAALALMVAGFVWFVRDNHLAWALILWTSALAGSLEQLFGNPMPALWIQGWLVAAALAVSLLWVVAPAFQKQSAVQAQSAGSAP